jgi:hypothetical protein
LCCGTAGYLHTSIDQHYQTARLSRPLFGDNGQLDTTGAASPKHREILRHRDTKGHRGPTSTSTWAVLLLVSANHGEMICYRHAGILTSMKATSTARVPLAICRR